MAIYENQTPAAQARELGTDIRVDVDEQGRVQRNGARHVSKVIQDMHGSQRHRWKDESTSGTTQPLGDTERIERIGTRWRVEPMRFDGPDRHEHDAICLDLLMY